MRASAAARGCHDDRGGLTFTTHRIMSDTKPEPNTQPPPPPSTGDGDAAAKPSAPPRENGGREDGLEPTRYGDWEKNGRCIDF